jgi:hypothetical protein
MSPLVCLTLVLLRDFVTVDSRILGETAAPIGSESTRPAVEGCVECEAS